MTTLDYEQLVAQYAASLTATLRGFRGGAEFLETWVHDEDDATSLLAIAESALDAGMDALQVRVGTATLAKLNVEDLKVRSASLGGLEVNEDGDGALFSFSLKQSSAKKASLKAPVAVRTKAVAAAVAPQRKAGDPIHESYREAVAAALKDIRCEGQPADVQGTRLTHSLDDGTLGIALDAEHSISVAWHSGAGSDERRALLDGLCQAIVGTPLVDAAFHGVIRLENVLRDETLAAPVAGIIAPHNADPAFGPLADAMSDLLTQYDTDGSLPRETNWEPSPSPQWCDMSEAAQLAKIQAVFAGVAASGDSAVAESVGRNFRITVRLPETLHPTEKASLLLRLERDLRKQVEPTLCLFQADVSDLNRLRRL